MADSSLLPWRRMCLVQSVALVRDMHIADTRLSSVLYYLFSEFIKILGPLLAVPVTMVLLVLPTQIKHQIDIFSLRFLRLGLREATVKLCCSVTFVILSPEVILKCWLGWESRDVSNDVSLFALLFACIAHGLQTLTIPRNAQSYLYVFHSQ
jgi:hypothetical protein